MTEIKYTKGDATKPVGEGYKIIVHICNNVGGWGAGFVLAVSKRWKWPEEMYRGAFVKRGILSLGEVQLVRVEEDTFVINMIAQDGIGPDKDGRPPIRYAALTKCLSKVRVVAKDLGTEEKTSVHMPRIGCGLAGGKWERVEEIVKLTLCKHNIPVTVYDYEPNRNLNESKD